MTPATIAKALVKHHGFGHWEAYLAAWRGTGHTNPLPYTEEEIVYHLSKVVRVPDVTEEQAKKYMQALHSNGREPVVVQHGRSMRIELRCGHIFDWPTIYQSLSERRMKNIYYEECYDGVWCPQCKEVIKPRKIVGSVASKS